MGQDSNGPIDINTLLSLPYAEDLLSDDNGKLTNVGDQVYRYIRGAGDEERRRIYEEYGIVATPPARYTPESDDEAYGL